uniref:SFRICE_013037 n=1 Tax=Spodoptera frugiperda TaxID=7108 RepID=A0A2H1V3H7_SPOFR
MVGNRRGPWTLETPEAIQMHCRHLGGLGRLGRGVEFSTTNYVRLWHRILNTLPVVQQIKLLQSDNLYIGFSTLQSNFTCSLQFPDSGNGAQKFL